MHYTAKVVWEKKPDEHFTDGKYSRAHRWRFDGGVEVPASSSPSVVPLPLSDASAVDPEEAFVAALSSCHMLFFLSIAAAQKFVVIRYEDSAEGNMGKNEAGDLAMLEVFLHPKVVFGEDARPTPEQMEAMHHTAHQRCFIANSVKSKITVTSS